MTRLERRSPRAISAMNDRKTSSSWRCVISRQHVHLHRAASPSERRLVKAVCNLTWIYQCLSRARGKINGLVSKQPEAIIFYIWNDTIEILPCESNLLAMPHILGKDGQNEFQIRPWGHARPCPTAGTWTKGCHWHWPLLNIEIWRSSNFANLRVSLFAVYCRVDPVYPDSELSPSQIWHITVLWCSLERGWNRGEQLEWPDSSQIKSSWTLQDLATNCGVKLRPTGHVIRQC